MTQSIAMPHTVVHNPCTDDGCFNTAYFKFVPLDHTCFKPTTLEEIPNFTLMVVDRGFKVSTMAYNVILKTDVDLKGILVDKMIKGAVEEFFNFLAAHGLTPEEIRTSKTGSEQRPDRKAYLAGLLRSLMYPNKDLQSLFRVQDSKVPFRLYLRYDVWVESRRIKTLASRGAEEGRNTLKGWLSFPNADVLYFLNGDSFMSFKSLAESEALATYIEHKFFRTWPFDLSAVGFGALYTGDDVGLSLLEIAHKYEYLPINN